MTIRAALALLLAAPAAPLAAQELELPSGRPARLFDVVLEAAASAIAPEALANPEAEDGRVAQAAPEAAPAGRSAAGPDRLGPELAVRPEGGLARFRLVVPGLGGEGADYDAVAGDFPWLCAELALPALDANGWIPTEVVIALSDRETVFGVPDPEAVQFFEGFRIDRGACVPQAF